MQHYCLKILSCCFLSVFGYLQVLPGFAMTGPPIAPVNQFYDEVLRETIYCINFFDQPALRHRLFPFPQDFYKVLVEKQLPAQQRAHPKDADAYSAIDILKPHTYDAFGNEKFCQIGTIPVTYDVLIGTIQHATHININPSQRELFGLEAPHFEHVKNTDDFQYYLFDYYYSTLLNHHLLSTPQYGVQSSFNIWPNFYYPGTIEDDKKSLYGFTAAQIWLMNSAFFDPSTLPRDRRKPIDPQTNRYIQVIEAGVGVFPWLTGSDTALHLWFYATRLNHHYEESCYGICDGFVQIANNVVIGHKGILIPLFYQHRLNASITNGPMKRIGLRVFAWEIPIDRLPARSPDDMDMLQYALQTWRKTHQDNPTLADLVNIRKDFISQMKVDKLDYRYRWTIAIKAQNFDGILGYFEPTWWDNQGKWRLTKHPRQSGTFARQPALYPGVGAQLFKPHSAQSFINQMGSGQYANTRYREAAYIGHLGTFPKGIKMVDTVMHLDEKFITPYRLKPSALSNQAQFSELFRWLPFDCYNFANSLPGLAPADIGMHFYYGGPGIDFERKCLIPKPIY